MPQVPEGGWRMITTLTGPNSFLIKNYVNKSIKSFSDKHGKLNIERVDGEEDDFDRISDALSGLSLFDSNKLVVVKKPSVQKQFTENFVTLVERVPDSTEVIIIEPKIDKRLSYYKALKSKTEFRELNNLDADEVSRWLTQQANEYGSSISITDARYMVERAGQDQMNLDSEIRKLATHSPGQISRQDIEELTIRSPQSTIFDLIDAAFKGKVNLALKLYEEQRQQLVEPQQIIAMLAWQLHILAIVLSSKGKNIQDISSEAKINPFVARKTQDLSRQVSFQRVRVLMNNLLSVDTEMKTTKINPDEALKAYIVGLGQPE